MKARTSGKTAAERIAVVSLGIPSGQVPDPELPAGAPDDAELYVVHVDREFRH